MEDFSFEKMNMKKICKKRGTTGACNKENDFFFLWPINENTTYLLPTALTIRVILSATTINHSLWW